MIDGTELVRAFFKPGVGFQGVIGSNIHAFEMI